jgi:hypothetical protein
LAANSLSLDAPMGSREAVSVRKEMPSGVGKCGC